MAFAYKWPTLPDEQYDLELRFVSETGQDEEHPVIVDQVETELNGLIQHCISIIKNRPYLDHNTMRDLCEYANEMLYEKLNLRVNVRTIDLFQKHDYLNMHDRYQVYIKLTLLKPPPITETWAYKVLSE